MRLCAYRVHHGMTAGIWVEQPEFKIDRTVKIMLAVRYAFENDEGLLLAFEPWP